MAIPARGPIGATAPTRPSKNEKCAPALRSPPMRRPPEASAHVTEAKGATMNKCGIFAIALSLSLIAGCGDEGAFFTTPTGARPTTGNSTPETPNIQLSGLVQRQDASGNARILGEATNIGGGVASFVQVQCALLDASGAVLTTRSTFVNGTVVKLTGTGQNTNTALRAGERGFFAISSALNNTAVASFRCDPSFDTFATTAPDATLELNSTPTRASDPSGFLRVSGEVKNTGTRALAFGQVYMVVMDAAGLPLDLSFAYIDGETVPPSAGTTDTGLNPDAVGSYTVSTAASLAYPQGRARGSTDALDERTRALRALEQAATHEE